MEAEPATPAQVRSETLVVTAVEQEGWNAITRVAFRFFFAYFVLYSFPFPLNSIPGSYVIVIGYRGPDGAARGWNAGKGIGVGARSIAIKMA